MFSINIEWTGKTEYNSIKLEAEEEIHIKCQCMISKVGMINLNCWMADIKILFQANPSILNLLNRLSLIPSHDFFMKSENGYDINSFNIIYYPPVPYYVRISNNNA